ncbi:hypothetical protein FJU11_17450 [Pararhizobium mangrovi]|uniref:Uncharacterized protein n=1 Tax=Pararhizobium mangrovi TaxID=2590452 RepID=A0A506TYP0_9HYPH|nr:hypothetical protein FJU11_17450 [Pararhizobium mangrovi]
MAYFLTALHKSATTNTFTRWDDVRDLLKTLWNVTLKDKNQNMLMSGSVFSSDAASDTQKGLADIVYAHMLQLDFDDSEMPPEAMSRLLQDVRHVAYNSFNNGRDALYRFRVMIPLSAPVTTEAYESLWDIIAQRVLAAGYSVGKQRGHLGLRSGMDVSKRTPASFMYLPSQACQKKHSFWIENWHTHMLDPSVWVSRAPDNAPEYEEHEAVSNQSHQLQTLMLAIRKGNQRQLDQQETRAAENRKERQRDAALAEWQAAPGGTGNAAFFRFAASLKRAGYDLIEIEQDLKAHHGDSHSHSSDRRKQIPSIMSSLRKQQRGRSRF